MKTTDTDPDIPILFEDNHLLVINKPEGILSQEDHTGRPDVLSLCKAYIREVNNKQGNVFLGLLHRLDEPVSGVMVLAKTSKAASRISEQIRKRSVRKRYRAVVLGSPPPNGVLEHYLEKDTSKNLVRVTEKATKTSKLAKLSFQTISRSDDLSLVDVMLETGRPHQIRVQFSQINAPIWGDNRYGRGKQGENIALHAYSFRLVHPTSEKRVTFQADPPNTYPWNLFQ